MIRSILLFAAMLAASPALAQEGGIKVDLTINMAAILTVAVVLGGGLVAWGTVRNQVQANASAIDDLETDVAAREAEIKLVAERVESVRAKSAKELDAFRIEVARSIPTNEALAALEDRLLDAVNRLGDKFDRFVEAQASGAHRIPPAE
ncbi:hypothetical protein [Oricola thermophila]|uniref:Uncharacterized protein n=1 Tax=Oricola thermophila TaxID=2742145 RepID=A0A6N1VHI8_9HYPH|nr:hypothetical protein [Oricola thermophila]QKV20224.1 hypothetical protein HTY61_18090 [Oricola thermophila]